jgi:hypothetical protein
MFLRFLADVCFMLSSGVEHLLRDVKDTTISTLATEVIVYKNYQDRRVQFAAFFMYHDPNF